MGLRNHSLLFYIWQGTLPLLEDMMYSYGQKHFFFRTQGRNKEVKSL